MGCQYSFLSPSDNRPYVIVDRSRLERLSTQYVSLEDPVVRAAADLAPGLVEFQEQKLLDSDSAVLS